MWGQGYVAGNFLRYFTNLELFNAEMYHFLRLSDNSTLPLNTFRASPLRRISTNLWLISRYSVSSLRYRLVQILRWCRVFVNSIVSQEGQLVTHTNVWNQIPHKKLFHGQLVWWRYRGYNKECAEQIIDHVLITVCAMSLRRIRVTAIFTI